MGPSLAAGSILGLIFSSHGAGDVRAEAHMTTAIVGWVVGAGCHLHRRHRVLHALAVCLGLGPSAPAPARATWRLTLKANERVLGRTVMPRLHAALRRLRRGVAGISVAVHLGSVARGHRGGHAAVGPGKTATPS